MDQLGKKLSQYVITIFLVIFGLMFLIKYLSGDELESQPVTMLWSSIFLILVGILAAPAIMAKFNRLATILIGFSGIVVAIFLAWSVWYSVDEEIEFQAKKQAIDEKVIQRLKDIREAQMAYAEYNGRYTNNFDTLLAWVKKPVIPITFKMGTFHDTLPEVDSFEKGYVLKKDEVDSVAQILEMDERELLEKIDKNQSVYKIIDTVYTSFYEENFTRERRLAKKEPLVSLDSLPFSPLKGERFVIRTGTVDKGGVTQPTILVQDPTPFGRDKVKKDTLRFGSLDEPITDGNWK